MTSSPHLFDQEITAQPCRVGCRRHVHAADLPSAYRGVDQLEVGADLPAGWTAQPRPWSAPRNEDVMWFMCNSCDDLVPEHEVEGHRCG